MTKTRIRPIPAIFFFIISLLPLPVLAEVPLRTPSIEKNQPTISLAKILAQQLDRKKENLKTKIRSATLKAQNNEIYLNLKARIQGISDSEWVNSEVNKAQEEGRNVVNMAVELQKQIDETPKLSDKVHLILLLLGARPPEDLKFGEKNANQILKSLDPILKNTSNYLKQIKNEAKPLAVSIKSSLTLQMKAWDAYFAKLDSLDKKADAKNADLDSIVSGLRNLKFPISTALPKPAPDSTLLSLSKHTLALQYFLANWRIAAVGTEIAKINLLEQVLEGTREDRTQLVNQLITHMKDQEQFLDETQSFLEKIPKENLTPEIQESIQTFLASHTELKNDNDQKWQEFFQFIQSSYFDPLEPIFSQLETNRDKLIDYLKDLEASKSVGVPPFLEYSLDEFQIPPLLPFPPNSYNDALFNALFFATGLQFDIASLGIFPREGVVKFEEVIKGILPQNTRPPDWPSSDFIVQNSEMAKRVRNAFNLKDRQTIAPFGGGYDGNEIWVVSSDFADFNSIKDMTITNGKLVITVIDGVKTNTQSSGLSVLIVRISDPEIVKAILKGAPVEFVHTPATA